MQVIKSLIRKLLFLLQMANKKIFLSWLLPLFLVAFTSPANCAEEQWVKSLSGIVQSPAMVADQIQNSKTIDIKDQWFDYMATHLTGSGSGAWDNIFRTNNAQAIVQLRYDDSKRRYTTNHWTLDLTYSITTYDPSGSSVTSTTLTGQTIHIDYNPASGQTSNDKQVKIYNNAYRAILTITAYSYQEYNSSNVLQTGLSSTTGPMPSYLADVWLDVIIKNDRSYFMDGSTPYVNQLSVQNNQLTISWPYIQGAESYDVEFVFIDIPSGTFANPDFVVDFSRATRVNTPNQFFGISLAYPRGKIVYRIRGVGDDPTHHGTREEGPWSYDPAPTTVCSGVTANTSTHFYSYNYDGLESSLNWQYSATYVEDGKKAEGIGFYDGSLHSRQNVTVSNTENNAVITETKYDYQGRPALQMMPDVKASEGLQYYQFYDATGTQYIPLNNSISGTTVHDGFPKTDYDDNTHVASGPEQAAASSGTGEYFSSSNPDQADEKAYIPDAQGYPFAQTRYMNDGTNRVRTQTGPGPDHKLGSGQETEYFYGTPTGQAEIDRLFGNEAGYVSHYKKNLVVDPNGQVSVTYLDQEGRVVATALAGDTPDNLLDLEYRENPQTLTANLLGNNHLSQSQAMVSQTTITVSSPGDFVFNYSLTNACYDDNCTLPATAEGCTDCVYDLVILVTNTDGDSIDLGIISGLYSYRQSNISSLSTVTFTSTFSNVGVYTVSKTLMMHSGVRQTLYDSYIANQRAVEEAYEADPGTNPAPCVLKPVITPEPCTFDCHTICEDQYHFTDDEGDYWVKDDGTITRDSAIGNPLIRTCEANLCYHQQPKEDPCAIKYEQMLQDMSPGGQYFDNRPAIYTVNPSDPTGEQITNPDYYSTITPSYSSGDINDWLTSNSVPLSAINDYPTTGTHSYTNWDEVRDNWNSAWAAVLINYHPEKCAYDYFCGGFSCSVGGTTHTVDQSTLFDYDWSMQQLHQSNMTSTSASGLFNPLGVDLNGYSSNGVTTDDHSTYGPATTGSTVWNSTVDPYFDCSHVVCTDSGNVNNNLEAGTVITNMLQNYIPVYDNTNTVITGRYFSIWYLLEDPDNIATGTPTSTGLSQGIIDLFSAVQTQLAAGLSQSDYFYGAYQYLKQLTIAMGYDEYVTAHSASTPPCVSSSSSPMHYTHGYLETGAGVGPQTVEGYTVHFPENPLYAGISNGCAAPSLTTMADLVSAVQDLADSMTPDLDPDPAYDQAGCSCDNLHQMLEALGIDPATFDANTATAGEQISIVDLVNDATQVTTLYVWTDIKPWLLECQGATPSMTNLTGLPLPYLCGEDEPNPLPADFVSQAQTDCEDENATIANNQAEQLYAQLLSFAAQNFVNDYSSYCMSSLTNRETFTVTYDLNEYYYTLYYYDQAGNLVKTVPPKGVDILDYPTAIGELTDVENHRVDAITYPTPTYPSHTFVTDYKYNSLQQLTESNTPDGGTTKFWYDEHGRIVASQDARQAAINAYSYVFYDALGRPYESGQLINGTALTYAISRNQDATTFSTWVAGRTGNKTEVVRSYYDETIDGSTSTYIAGGQENLRNRISSVTYDETDDGNDANNNTDYDNATHYSYDIHGNVATVVQENKDFHLADIGQSKKRIDYTYDVASGKVNQVDYQSDPDRDGKHAFDEFHYKYEYDANNRMVVAYSSRDAVIWEKEQKNFYYPHGPLARTEIGDKEVQGQDYAYTILGWIKGVNSDTKQDTRDIGKDAINLGNGLEGAFAYDAYGYSLDYFAGDFKTIATLSSGTKAFAALTASQPYATAVKDLFNGNISGMSTALTSETETDIAPQGRAFRYDQLNRIRQANAFADANVVTNNAWGSAAADNGNYYEEFHYDLNGNILAALRNGNLTTTHQEMDDLTYHYTTSGYNNRLLSAEDNATSLDGDYGSDINSGQLVGNYQYDASGNLIIDDQEDIGDASTSTQGIFWNSKGKIKKVTRYSGSKDELEYIYDAMGNRIVKIDKPRPGSSPSSQDAWTYTYYARDAQGNVLATYKRQFTGGSGSYVDNYSVTEQDIYGSSRVGVRQSTDIAVQQTNFSATISSLLFNVSSFSSPPGNATWSNGELLGRTLGYKAYELANHLGNVLEVVNDKKLVVAQGNVLSTPFISTVEGWTTTGTGSTPSFSGGRLKVVTTLLGAGVYQDVSTTANTNYSLTFDLDVTSQYKVDVTVVDNTSSDILESQIGFNRDGTYSVHFTAEGTSTRLKFTSHNTPPGSLTNTFYLDNISCGNTGMAEHYLADVQSYTDYYAFGSPMSGRNYVPAVKYRYGYNGMEKADEISGEGTEYTTEFRQYDARLGRWMSLDPDVTSFPSCSPYCSMGNNPISLTDIKGDHIGGRAVDDSHHDQDEEAKQLKETADKMFNGKVNIAYKYQSETGEFLVTNITVKEGRELTETEQAKFDYVAGLVFSSTNYNIGLTERPNRYFRYTNQAGPAMTTEPFAYKMYTGFLSTNENPYFDLVINTNGLEYGTPSVSAGDFLFLTLTGITDGKGVNADLYKKGTGTDIVESGFRDRLSWYLNGDYYHSNEFYMVIKMPNAAQVVNINTAGNVSRVLKNNYRVYEAQGVEQGGFDDPKYCYVLHGDYKARGKDKREYRKKYGSK